MIQTPGPARFGSCDPGVRLAVVLLSLGFHAVVLGPILLGQLGRNDGGGIIECPFPFMAPSPPMQVTLERGGRSAPLERLHRPPSRKTMFPYTPPVPDDQEGVSGGASPAGTDPTSSSTKGNASGTSPGVAIASGADPLWQVQTGTVEDRMARALRIRAMGCRAPETLSHADRAACEDRFARTAAVARALDGTGNAARDGRFAREGAAALARYEARRGPVSGGTGVTGATAVGVTGISGDCAGGNLRGNCPGGLLTDGFRHEEDSVRQPRAPN